MRVEGILAPVKSDLSASGHGNGGCFSIGYDILMEDLGLFFIERRLLSIADCLVPVGNRLFEVDDLLLSVRFVLDLKFNVL